MALGLGRAAAIAPVAPATAGDRPGLAIGLYLTAGFFFVSMDALAKQLTAVGYAPEQIIMLRYFLALVGLLPVIVLRRRERPLATRQPWLQAGRGVLVIAAATFFVYSVRSLPLATATAIGFVSPLFVTVLSILFLKEKVGPRRWAAIFVGFLGVLVIIRPGAVAFDVAMLLPMAASFCWACALIITRAMKGREGALAILVWSTGFGLVVIAPLGLAVWRPLDLDAVLLVGLLAVCHLVAQMLVIRAFAYGAASLVAPFAYMALVWATLIGYLAFDALPDGPTLAGAVVLASAGVYVWHRERRQAAAESAEG